MFRNEQKKRELLDYLRRIGALPKHFALADESDFIGDLCEVCLAKDATHWQQQSFMFDKYGSENLDFQFLITAAAAVIGSDRELPSSSLSSELIRVAEAFLKDIAPGMPLELMRSVSEFVVLRSAFHSDMPMVRAPLDACAADWEDYPLPSFRWSWTELEDALALHQGTLPADLQTNQRDLGEWREAVRARPDGHWLAECHVRDLRHFQKRYGLAPARTKHELIERIVSLTPLPNDIQEVIDRKRRYDLDLVAQEERMRQRPLSEIYKRHLVRLVQTRVDSYFAASYGWNSPRRQSAKIDANNASAGLRAYEDARGMDLTEVEAALRASFDVEFGGSWRTKRATTHLFNRFMRDARWRASASLSDFIERENVVSAMWLTPDERSTLVVRETCVLCGRTEKRLSFRSADDLPPFHLLCLCSPPSWEVDFLAMRPSDLPLMPRFEDAVSDVVRRRVAGAGIAVSSPTLRDMVAITEAYLADDDAKGSKPQEKGMSNNTNPRWLGLRRLFSRSRRKT